MGFSSGNPPICAEKWTEACRKINTGREKRKKINFSSNGLWRRLNEKKVVFRVMSEGICWVKIRLLWWRRRAARVTARLDIQTVIPAKAAVQKLDARPSRE
jgi:hypothetical protein